MTFVSLCPLPNYIFTFKWASFVRILAGVHTFYYETICVCLCMKQKYKHLPASTNTCKRLQMYKFLEICLNVLSE